MDINVDFRDALNTILSSQPIIHQCIIQDYATGDDGSATCTVVLPNAINEDIEGDTATTLKNINCLVGSNADITFENYMSGILINFQAPYTTAMDISQQSEITKYDYFNITTDNLLAIILPNQETMDNILTSTIRAQNLVKLQASQVYVGDESTNVLNELSEYLTKLKSFFDDMVSYMPSVSLQPGTGAASLVTSATTIGTETQSLYQKISAITDVSE